MKNTFLKFVLIPLLILGFAGSAFAYTVVNTGKITPAYQKPLSGLQQNQAYGIWLEAQQASVITGVEVVAGANAELVGIYDYSPSGPLNSAGTVSPTPAAQNAVLELSTAANTATFYDFSNTPIRTVYGIEASQSQNVAGNGFIIYTQQYP